ncbi:MAG: DUF3795 domain-containing protein [Lachnospiraceae bacterium]|nr:DUF3795 domain-containing protein [Lachnospiraceae bacterium]
MGSVCGIDCGMCELKEGCNGCMETGGRPFGAECIVAMCYQKSETALEELKENLIREFNELGIEDMEEVTDLNALKGDFVNLEYTLPGGKRIKIWDDNRIYLGNQLHKAGGDKCYGIVADEKYLMVSEYGAFGADAEIVVFKRWN